MVSAQTQRGEDPTVKGAAECRGTGALQPRGHGVPDHGGEAPTDSHRGAVWLLGSKGGAGPLPKTPGPGRTADPNSRGLAGREPVSTTGPFPAPPLLELRRS